MLRPISASALVGGFFSLAGMYRKRAAHVPKCVKHNVGTPTRDDGGICDRAENHGVFFISHVLVDVAMALTVAPIFDQFAPEFDEIIYAVIDLGARIETWGPRFADDGEKFQQGWRAVIDLPLYVAGAKGSRSPD